MPFARNEATRFISPTKTPEYLAAGLPVVSTSIRDVVEPYGRLGFAAIADSVEETLVAISQVVAEGWAPAGAVDQFLGARSWDATWTAMDALLESRLDQLRADERPVIRPQGGVRRIPEPRTPLEGAATMTLSRGRSGEND